jgi:hypothetical protein
VAFGGLAAWGFLLIGETCAHTGQASYVGAWSRTLGGRSSFLPAVASLLLCSTAGIACASVLADTGAELLAALLSLPLDDVSRNGVLLGVAVTMLTPLCLLPSLAPLGTVSYFGVAGVGITAACMLVRLFDGSYSLAEAAAPLPSPADAAASIDATAILVSAHFGPAPAEATAAAAATAAGHASSSAAADASPWLLDFGSVSHLAAPGDGAPGSLLSPSYPPLVPPATTAASTFGLESAGGLSEAGLSLKAGGSPLYSPLGGLSGGAGAGLASLALLPSRLPSMGALAFFVSLMSNAYLAHYNAPGVLTALQPNTKGGGRRVAEQRGAGYRAVSSSELDSATLDPHQSPVPLCPNIPVPYFLLHFRSPSCTLLPLTLSYNS